MPPTETTVEPLIFIEDTRFSKYSFRIRWRNPDSDYWFRVTENKDGELSIEGSSSRFGPYYPEEPATALRILCRIIGQWDLVAVS